jgi:hypothetical protein
MALFWLYCCFTGCEKIRNIDVSTQRCAKKLFKKVLAVTPRFATQCEIRAKNFLVDCALCIIARSHLHLRISLRIRNHMQK